MGDRVAKASLEAFRHHVPATKIGEREWTILSAIVAEFGSDETLEVVAFGTGLKCIGPSKKSPEGFILNDSHSEVISRRSFIRFCLRELSALVTSGEKVSKYFERIGDATCSPYFRVKTGVKFHLYVSHAPCELPPRSPPPDTWCPALNPSLD